MSGGNFCSRTASKLALQRQSGRDRFVIGLDPPCSRPPVSDGASKIVSASGAGSTRFCSAPATRCARSRLLDVERNFVQGHERGRARLVGAGRIGVAQGPTLRGLPSNSRPSAVAAAFGEVVEEDVPLRVEMLGAVARWKRSDPAVRRCDRRAHRPIRRSSASSRSKSTVMPKIVVEILLDRRVDGRKLLVARRFLREHGIEQHVLLHVLLGGAVGELDQHAAIVGHGVEIEVARQHHHVALLLVHEVHGLARRNAAEADDGAGGRNRIRGDQRQLARRADDAHAKTAAGRHAELDLVEHAELHLRIGEHHLDVAARNVLEELHVDVLLLDLGRQNAAQLGDDLLGFLARDLLVRHHLADADVDRLQLEQDEEALEDRNVELLLAHELLVVAPLVLPGRGAAVVDQALVEGLEVDVEIEAVVRFLGQDQLDVGGIDADIVGMLEDDLDLLEQRASACRAARRRCTCA